MELIDRLLSRWNSAKRALDRHDALRVAQAVIGLIEQFKQEVEEAETDAEKDRAFQAEQSALLRLYPELPPL